LVKLDSNQKFQVLMAELSERYNAAHKIRERSIQFTLWLSGMAIGLAWLLLSEKWSLSSQHRVALTFIEAALFGGGLHFLMGLARGFRTNREAMLRVELALGLHDSGEYLSKDSLLPREYNRITRKWSHHFVTLYIWLTVVGFSLLCITLAHSILKNSVSSPTKIEQRNGGQNNG
jgi:hypothetical protein